MTDAEINSLVEPVLRRQIGDRSFERSEVESGRDHDGDPVLYVRVYYRPNSEGASLTDLVLAVLRTLQDAGETRFPHVRPIYPDDEVGIEDHDAQSA